jgi:hypothetical protein
MCRVSMTSWSPYASTADIPIPDDLTPAKRAEYVACRAALANLEDEWRALETGENADIHACQTVIAQAQADRERLAKDRTQLRFDLLEAHVAEERKRIAAEDEAARAFLKARILRGYVTQYQSICSELEAAMAEAGLDFAAVMQDHAIEFPPGAADPPPPIGLSDADAVRLERSAEDCERDLKAVLASFGDDS